MQKNNKIVRMENSLAKKGTQMDTWYQKTFYITLANIGNINNDNEVCIQKEDLFRLMNITDNDRHSRLRKRLHKLASQTYMTFGNDEQFKDGYLIVGYRTTRKELYIEIGRRYIDLVKELKTNYTRLLLDDSLTFKSKHSMMLYQQLMRINGYGIVKFTTKQLKEFFGLEEKSYVKPSGKFNRSEFENKTIDVAVNEINAKSKCIKNLRYEKSYRGRSVEFYVFEFEYIDPDNYVSDSIYEKPPIQEHNQVLYDSETGETVEHSEFDWLHEQQ